MARRLGISEGTVFTYFTGKRDLCVRVICNWYDEIIGEIEENLPRISGTREKLNFLIRSHLYHLTVEGPGLCALILSEGRAEGETFGDEIVRLQRRYTAPMMSVLADGVAAGDIRVDLPLSLLRSSIYGPMEHVLWDAVSGKRVNIDTVSTELSDFLWQGLQPPNVQVAALSQLQRDLTIAMEKYESRSSSLTAKKPAKQTP
jgi:AcrR family transcriptional regulator